MGRQKFPSHGTIALRHLRADFFEASDSLTGLLAVESFSPLRNGWAAALFSIPLLHLPLRPVSRLSAAALTTISVLPAPSATG